jgi:putative OPT family oligopeptide transporter
MEEKRRQSYVPADSKMREFSIKALLIGLVMCVVLGAANAYLGLKAGMTIAATYPAAVIGMALLRVFKGTILEENYARTVGSIGESVAAGAIFTLPAFLIAGVWKEFWTPQHYFEASAILLIGGILGILFVTILRRVMVEDKDLPFPESVAAAEIHKAGQGGQTGAQFLFWAMGLGAVIQGLKSLKLFKESWEHFLPFAKQQINLKTGGTAVPVTTGGGALLSTPGVSPAYMGVGYIIGPKLAALNFTGGLLAWGLFVPLLLYFLGPQLVVSMQGTGLDPNASDTWVGLANQVWRSIVRPVAIGGMLMSAAFTLFRMRKSLGSGLSRAMSDVRKAAGDHQATERTDRDLPFNQVFVGILLAALAVFAIYLYFTHHLVAAIVATVVMIIAGFFFSAVSGNLVGLIGSSNNPISGLTISTLIVAALLMVALGVAGMPGVAAVLGVAAVACVTAAVAGEMLQDLKVGYILGGTPWKMQLGDMLGVLVASAVMFIPLVILNQGDIAMGGSGLGGKAYPAPQASLMAILASGIVGHSMAWPLIIVGILMAFGFILLQVKSPMLVCVGMYLPLETSFAIFIGGLIKGVFDSIAEKRGLNRAQKIRAGNNGTLLAAGLIAGEALVGLVFAGLAVANIKYDTWLPGVSKSFPLGFHWSLLVFVVIGWVLIRTPLSNAGKPDDPAPPEAMV